jgi:hypothetical protein
MSSPKTAGILSRSNISPPNFAAARMAIKANRVGAIGSVCVLQHLQIPSLTGCIKEQEEEMLFHGSDSV